MRPSPITFRTYAVTVGIYEMGRSLIDLAWQLPPARPALRLGDGIVFLALAGSVTMWQWGRAWWRQRQYRRQAHASYPMRTTP
jgi:hypothetical protein